MIKRLMVPLDGSHLAESALSAAAHLAAALHAEVMLFHAIERNAPHEIHGDRHMTSAEEGRDYLAEIARRFFVDVAVEYHVHSVAVEDVARCIVDHADELHVDLIVMCTHGTGGLRSWLFGSIAQQVIARGATPLLLIQPSGAGTAPRFECRRMLAPLDGDPDHEHGLPVAVELARICGAEIHLLVAVHTLQTLTRERAATATLLPGATATLLDLTQQGAQEYLSGIVARLANEHVVVTAEVKRGHPVTTIVQTAERVQADLILLGTHGKSQMDAFWAGSVTPRIAEQSHLPLLLVPVRAAGDPSSGKLEE